jgi:hypothetical protein
VRAPRGAGHAESGWAHAGVVRPSLEVGKGGRGGFGRLAGPESLWYQLYSGGEPLDVKGTEIFCC